MVSPKQLALENLQKFPQYLLDVFHLKDRLKMHTWRNFTNVEFGVCVSVVSFPTVQSSDNSESVNSGVGQQSSVEESV